MQIIDKNKDYYDYMRMYGVDKAITFDRRGSVVLSRIDLLRAISPVRDYYKREDEAQYFVLEAGFTQWVFSANIKYEKAPGLSIFDPVSGVIQLKATFKDNKHYFPKEIAIAPVDVPRSVWNFMGDWRHWTRRKDLPIERFSDLELLKDRAVLNPILRETHLASFIPAMDIWAEISNYVSSKNNDRDAEIVNSDVDKIVNHGFDKKASFRNLK
jgi:hypothetical protein